MVQNPAMKTNMANISLWKRRNIHNPPYHQSLGSVSVLGGCNYVDRNI